MEFVSQTKPKTCNIACLQMVLSAFSKEMTEEEINQKLPQHNFGSLLTELEIFLKENGINAKIIDVKDVIPEIIDDQPIIVSLCRNSLYQKGEGIAPHYVVVQKTGDMFMVFDPLNDEQIIKDFETLKNASLKSKELYPQNGSWLFCSITHKI